MGKNPYQKLNDENEELVEKFWIAAAKDPKKKELVGTILEDLKDWFTDKKAVEAYLQKKVILLLQAVDTTPPSKYTHALIRVPDDDRTIEWAFQSVTTQNIPTKVQQEEKREVTRRTLAKIIRAAVTKAGNKVTPLNTEIYRGDSLRFYVPFKNDCFTFVNEVLEAAGEKPSKLHHRTVSADPEVRTHHGEQVTQEQSDKKSSKKGPQVL